MYDRRIIQTINAQIQTNVKESRKKWISVPNTKTETPPVAHYQNGQTTVSSGELF